MNGSIYITTAIPYVNAPPHVGFALEAVIADVLARRHRLSGANVRFCTGTDENSLKNVLAADAAGKSPAELVAEHALRYEALGPALGIAFDDFIRTSTDPRHAPAVERLWSACAERGDLYQAPYEGLYCTGCEQFYRADELAQGLCEEHGTRPETVCETNWFFRLSRYGPLILDHIERGALRIEPAHRRNEVVRFIERGLADISVSRSVARAHGWGIPVPGDPTQIVYVWFDALANYISALGYASEASAFTTFWQAADERIHVIGKGVSRFHAVYWPAILLSAGIALPTRLLVHGYVTVDGEKISKSLGNTIDPIVAARACGVDAFRYYLLRHVGSHSDGDFSLARLQEAYENDLGNRLGNLVSRVVGLLVRYFEGRAIDTAPSDSDITRVALALDERVDRHIEAFALHKALAEIFDVVDACNAFVNKTAPWVLAREARFDELARVIGDLVWAVRRIGVALRPFLPDTAARLLDALAAPTAGDEVLFPRR